LFSECNGRRRWTGILNFAVLMSSLLLVLLASAFVDGFEISLCFSSVGAETCCCCRFCIVLDLLGCIIVL
jgi:hypothetical protein